MSALLALAFLVAAHGDEQFPPKLQLTPNGLVQPQAPAQPQAPEPTPAPSLDPAFLLLPGYETQPMPVASPGPTKVGDRIEMRVTGVTAPDLKMDVAPGSESLADLGWEVLLGKQENGELHFTAVPLKPGKVTLPSLALKDASGKAIARTNPWTADVASAIKSDDPKPEEPVELRPPLSLRFPWWVLVAMFLAVALIGAGALYAVQRWSRKNRPVAATPAIPEEVRSEDELALAALAEIEREGLAKKGDYKKHYFRVSEILKEYIGKRYRIDAPEMTSREIVLSLEEVRGARSGVNDRAIDDLEQLFERLDLVKFTDHKPTLDDSGSSLEEARRFVLATRKPPQIIQQPGALGGVNAS